MQTQQILPGYVSGSETSRAAAVSMSAHAVTLRANVHAFVAERVKATCFDAEYSLKLTHPTCSARFRELVMLGKLRDTGEKAPNIRGIMVTLYETCDLPPNFAPINGKGTRGKSSSKATRETIRKTVQDLGDATADEVQIITGILMQTVTPAITDMVFLGQLEETGTERLTRGGKRMARVLRVKVA